MYARNDRATVMPTGAVTTQEQARFTAVPAGALGEVIRSAPEAATLCTDVPVAQWYAGGGWVLEGDCKVAKEGLGKPLCVGEPGREGKAVDDVEAVWLSGGDADAGDVWGFESV